VLNIHSGHDDEPPDAQLLRLDNMLIAEGLTGPDKGGSSSVASVAAQVVAGASTAITAESAIEHADYQSKLAQIRQIYHVELEKYEQVWYQLLQNTVSVYELPLFIALVKYYFLVNKEE